MITIVRNLSLRFLQSTEKSNILLSSLGKDVLSEEDDKEKNIELELLLSAIELLPEGNREIFKLSVLDGLSHKEIGGSAWYQSTQFFFAVGSGKENAACHID